LKWHLQSPFPLLHSIAIDLQEAKDFINEEDPRPTSFTWSYISSHNIVQGPKRNNHSSSKWSTRGKLIKGFTSLKKAYQGLFFSENSEFIQGYVCQNRE